MASSFLYSSAGGRIVTILPEPGVDYEPIVNQSRGPEALDSEEEIYLKSKESWDARTTFVSGSVTFFNHTSEALDLFEPSPDLSGLPTLSRTYGVWKRVFDVSLAILIAPVVAAMLAVIGGLIALSSEGDIFFRHPRIGQHGREFRIWKFRTMRQNADRILAEYLKRNPAAREEWNRTHKLRNDPRITKLGKVLRKTSLDELPQILNVFAGDMSFVGPRPIVRAESAKYAQRFAYYLAAVPGITGLWQVSGRCDVTYEARTILDETYVCKWSMARDIWILLKTPRVVFHRNGAY